MKSGGGEILVKGKILLDTEMICYKTWMANHDLKLSIHQYTSKINKFINICSNGTGDYKN
jgi:hypothetical protein